MLTRSGDVPYVASKAFCASRKWELWGEGIAGTRTPEWLLGRSRGRTFDEACARFSLRYNRKAINAGCPLEIDWNAGSWVVGYSRVFPSREAAMQSKEVEDEDGQL